jgi:hypothetical protein
MFLPEGPVVSLVATAQRHFQRLVTIRKKQLQGPGHAPAVFELSKNNWGGWGLKLLPTCRRENKKKIVTAMTSPMIHRTIPYTNYTTTPSAILHYIYENTRNINIILHYIQHRVIMTVYDGVRQSI